MKNELKRAVVPAVVVAKPSEEVLRNMKRDLEQRNGRLLREEKAKQREAEKLATKVADKDMQHGKWGIMAAAFAKAGVR